MLIHNVRIIDGDQDFQGEVLLEGDRIKDIGKPGEFSGVKDVQKIDGQGKWLMPGLIDLHVHFREPGFEWKETIATGVAAAASGGYTSVACMPNTKPTNDTAEVTRFILEKAKQANSTRVLPIGAVSKGLQGKELSPLSELREAGCFAFSDDGEPIYDSGMMRRALEWSLMLDAVICCHEEDKNLSCCGCMNESALAYRLGLRGMPGVAEDVMVARDIELARFTGGRVHLCHVSTARSVELVRRAKNDGILVTAEVTPHHLTLTEKAVENFDTNFKMSPPLRSEADLEACVIGLKDGTLDAVASDHAPHDLDSKAKEFSSASFGILGLQTNLSILLSFVHREVISPKTFVQRLSAGPASIFKLPGGKIRKGAVADLILLDPDKRWNLSAQKILSKSKNSPFIGQDFVGANLYTIVGGKIVWQAN